MAGSADALVLFIDNTEPLYRGVKNAEGTLARKKARGVYDAKRAPQMFSYVVEEGARRYVKEMGESEGLPKTWYEAFPKSVREEAAVDLAKRFEGRWETERAQYEKDLPKKYQGGKGVAVSRMTKADGAPYDNQVTVEQRDAGGAWKTVRVYQAKESKARKGSGAKSAWHVYRFLSEDGTKMKRLGRFPSESEAYTAAKRLGGDQIQEGKDGRVVNVERAHWLPQAHEAAKKHESGKNPHTAPSGKKYERVEILRSRSGSWMKPGQFAIVVGENLKPSGERYEVYTDDGPTTERAFLVGKSERSGATWFKPDALRFTRAASSKKRKGGKNDAVMSLSEIGAYLSERRISQSGFWQKAMGGDMAPLPRSTVIRIAKSLSSGSAGKHERGDNPKVDRSVQMAPEAGIAFLPPSFGDQRYSYVPLSRLSVADQARAIRIYVHKSVGARYDFEDRHYYYPVKADGTLPFGGRRQLAIPLAVIMDDAKMRLLGYAAPNPGWHERGKNPKTKSAKTKKLVREGSGMARLVWLPVNQAFIFVFGDSHLRLSDEPLFFQARSEAVAAARRHGLDVEKSGKVIASGPNPFAKGNPFEPAARTKPGPWESYFEDVVGALKSLGHARSDADEWASKIRASWATGQSAAAVAADIDRIERMGKHERGQNPRVAKAPKPKKASAKRAGAKRATKAAKREGVVVSSGLRSRLDNILGKR